jgi:hypothetical protein
MKIVLFIATVFLFSEGISAQSAPGLQSNRIYVSFVSPDVRFKKDVSPRLSVNTHWNTKAWKGEKVHTKVLLWATASLEKISLKCGDLKGSSGYKIPEKNINASFLQYVITDGLNAKGSGCGVTRGVDSSLVEDLISKQKVISIKANNVQPIWLSIQIPANANPAVYEGLVKVKNGNNDVGELKYTIEVINRRLPEPEDWKFHLDLWQNPYAVARVHNVIPWSKQHMRVMRPYMEMLADAGQKTITATIIHDPWISQTYDVYQSMVKWTKKKNGTWNYDYSVFDQWVSYMKSIGIGALINCYSMIPWNVKFYYYDESKGKDTFLVGQPGTTEYAAHWKPMLVDFARHLKQKGWFNHTAIAMDERPMEAMQKAIAVIKAADKDFKISVAGKFHPELQSDLFDYSVASNQVIDSSALVQRKNAGFTTTFYTSCSEGYPNTFTFSPPAEAAWLGWHAANKSYDGYLRWAYNCWPENPSQDSRFKRLAAGDTYLVYPGYQSSVRFERLREGIQDFEKIRILKEEFRSKNEMEKLGQLERVLKQFEIDQLKSRKAGDMLIEAKAVINSL